MGKTSMHVPSREWRIRITFADALGPAQYTTPDIRLIDPGWGNETLRRRIERLELFLPTGHKILLSGMEQYNFFVEAVHSLSGRGTARIEAFWLAGKIPNEDVVEMWRIGDGRVVRSRAAWGHEWGGSPTRGWKDGSAGVYVSAIVRV